MSNGPAAAAPARREQLSALVDGELPTTAAVTAACAAWKDDAEMRAAWHGYQLIGDVLRSEDLASEPARDAAFMQALRERLAAEPVVLAPMAPASGCPTAPTGRRRGWVMSAAVAAGFVAVAGALLVTRAPAPAVDSVLAGDTRPAPWIAGGPSPLAVSASAAPGATAEPLAVLDPTPARESPFVTRNRILLRDPQLDRYLAAHKQFAGNMALGMPAGILRNASAEAPGR